MLRFFLLALVVAVSACGRAPTFESAYAKYKDRNYKEAVLELKTLADSGDYRAQVIVGHYYLSGDERSMEMSAKYLKLAADQGESDAMFFLGGMYMRGEGVPQNEEFAIGYFKKAADANNPLGMHALGQVYMSRFQKTPSIEAGRLAVKWYEAAFEYGSDTGASDISSIYRQSPMSDEVRKAAWELTHNKVVKMCRPGLNVEFTPFFIHGSDEEIAIKLDSAEQASLSFFSRFLSKKRVSTVLDISSITFCATP